MLPLHPFFSGAVVGSFRGTGGSVEDLMGRGLNVGQTAQVSRIEWYGTRQLSSAALLVYTTTVHGLLVRDLIFQGLCY